MNGSFDLQIIDSLPCVVRGPANGRPLLIVQPLFEEMNRTRRLLALIAADLAAAGIRSWMPDLPGTGDAEDGMDWASWQQSLLRLHANLESQIAEPVAVFAVRGGALLTNVFPRRYVLAPVSSGAALLRDLLRSRAAANRDDGERADRLAELLKTEPIDLAGYRVTPALASHLGEAVLDPGDARIATVGDGGFAGPPVWRQGEPEDARALASAVAADVLRWMNA